MRPLAIGYLFGCVLTVTAVCSSPSYAGDVPPPILVGTPAEREAEARIREALATPIVAVWDGERLDTVLTQLQSRLGIKIRTDKQSLEAINITGENLVTIDARGQTVRATLDALLHSIDPTLVWTIADETLTITTKEAAQERMQTRVYPVGDLVILYEGEYPDFEPLIELIQKSVDPPSWDAEGGPGAIQEFAAGTAIVCTQTRDVHEKIEGLLAVLRQARQTARPYWDAYAEAVKADASREDYRGLGYYSDRYQRYDGPVIDNAPDAWRVPQRYDD